MAVSLDHGGGGATPLDADELDGLIPSHITTRAELDEWESRNVLKAEKWLLGRRREDILSPEFMRELHQRMFDETWKWAGKFRLLPPIRVCTILRRMTSLHRIFGGLAR